MFLVYRASGASAASKRVESTTPDEWRRASSSGSDRDSNSSERSSAEADMSYSPGCRRLEHRSSEAGTCRFSCSFWSCASRIVAVTTTIRVRADVGERHDGSCEFSRRASSRDATSAIEARSRPPCRPSRWTPTRSRMPGTGEFSRISVLGFPGGRGDLDAAGPGPVRDACCRRGSSCSRVRGHAHPIGGAGPVGFRGVGGIYNRSAVEHERALEKGRPGPRRQRDPAGGVAGGSRAFSGSKD